MATLNRNVVQLFDRWGAHEARVLAYTGPSSYATGGDTLPGASISLGKQVEAVVGLVIVNAALNAIRVGVYDHTNGKILWFVPNTGAEVANGTDLSGFTGRFVALGK